MAIVQDIYNQAPAIGYPGMVANGETSNRISRIVEDAAGIAFGKAAYRGAGDRGVTATPAAGALLGFVIADHGQVSIAGRAADTVPQYATAALMNAGALYVTAGTATTDGAAVYVAANGDITATGTDTAATGWVFDDTVASGAIVRIVRR